MQLRPPVRSGPPADDVASTLGDAGARLGHLPGVTLLLADARYEQSVASLAQWAAKGAHLLELELLVEPGDTIRLDAPASWTTAAVALAAWWAGCAITLDTQVEATVAVVHAERPIPSDVADVLLLGDEIDGAPAPVGGMAAGGPEAWTRAVQSFPDQPPRPRGRGTSPAYVRADATIDQATLLQVAAGQGEGTAGLDADSTDPLTALVAISLRPLVIGRPTVVLRGVGRDRANGERVVTWL